MQTVAERIASAAYGAGARHAFGIPGAEIIELMDAIDRVGISFHLVKHENGGGFMADAVAQLTGAPALLMGTLGPGVANMATAVANAHLDRTPMIVLTGTSIEDAASAKTIHMLFDHSAFLKSICKRSVKLASGCPGSLIDDIIALATDGIPGSVHIDVPTGVVSTAITGDSASRPRNNGTDSRVDADLATLLSWLAEAERPLILAGVGVLRHQAHEELRTLVRKSGACVITSYKAKGVIPEDDPSVVGGSSLSTIADRALFKVMKAADLVLCAGFDPVELRDGWGQPWDSNANTAAISPAPRDHKVFETKLEITANLKAALGELAAKVEDRNGATWRGGLPADAREEAQTVMQPENPSVWGPYAVIETCRSVFPRETIATSDTGAHRILLSQVWQCYEPHGLLQSTGLATMGYGLPAAIGAKLVRRDRPVVCFTGDAGLEMVIGELATLRSLGLPLTIVCFTDNSLALIELKQRRMKLKNLGVDFPGTNFVAVARAYGGNGVRVTGREELEEACRSSLRSDKFTLIEAAIDKTEYDGQIL
jgi:acetolactate synthase-1/2/3 large subunit